MALRDKLTKYWWVFAGLIVLAFVIIFFTSCKPGDNPLRSEWEDEIESAYVSKGIDKKYWQHFDFKGTTAQGARYFSTVQLPAEAVLAIDQGLGHQIKEYSRLNPQWVNYTKISDYDVHVIDPMCVNEDGSPCLLVNGWQSAGTMFGSCETCEAINKRPILVVVHQQAQSWRYITYFRNSVQNESEHVREWMNDPTGAFVYWITRPEGDVHPHVGSYYE